jgi:menaquinone-dependent protoporphyrinogen oxidase
MKTLVAYATKYGATQQIAERIAETLTAAGVGAQARPIKTITDVSGYDAFVVGSAVYMGSWRKEALAFARRFRDTLACHPVWLFSSGPLGAATVDPKGNDVRQSAEPKQLPELEEMLRPRDHHVFFGASDHTHFDVGDRLVYSLPPVRKLLVDGDFRDWDEVDAWVKEIARALVPAPDSAAIAPS